MPRRLTARSKCFVTALALLVCAVQVFSTTSFVQAGCRFGGFRNRGVGGISIDAGGVVSTATIEDRATWRKLVSERTGAAPDGILAPVGIRKISLRRLEAAIQESREAGRGILPEEIEYLAGLQRIEYVLVDPEHNDIIIAGPGEGWTVNDRGDVVGITTGRPVIQLDDLLVALRSVKGPREDTIQLSIDPTDEGRKNFDAFIKKMRRFSLAVKPGVEKAMGPQQISVSGIPADSRFARILLAADYKMKRLAMHHEPAPVAGLPSFLQLMKAKGQLPTTSTPRWWLACNYEPLVRSTDGLAWNLRGTGVKVMTEDDYYADGKITRTGRTSPAAKEWANRMTEHYEALSRKEPVFAELRNLMDLSVLAALIDKQNLLEVAGCRLPLLMGTEGNLDVDSWHAPSTVATECSFIKVGREWVISASGGVEIDSWSVADRSVIDEKVEQVRRESIANAPTKWWWN